MKFSPSGSPFLTPVWLNSYEFRWTFKGRLPIILSV